MKELRLLRDTRSGLNESQWPLYDLMEFYKTEAIKIMDSPTAGNVSSFFRQLEKENDEDDKYKLTRQTYENRIGNQDPTTSTKVKKQNISFNQDSAVSTQVKSNMKSIASLKDLNQTDETFFETIAPFTEALVCGPKKLDLRIELIRLVKNYCFNRPHVPFKVENLGQYLEEDEEKVKDDLDMSFFYHYYRTRKKSLIIEEF